VIRRGLLVFVAFALATNIAAVFGHSLYVGTDWLRVLPGNTRYVAAQRSLHRDRQLDAISAELEVARRIQSAILPSAFPESAHFKVAACYAPMTSVAENFYDFLLIDNDQAGILIADVSGHGVPAALIASMVKLAATSQRAFAADPAALLSGMNTALFWNTRINLSPQPTFTLTPHRPACATQRPPIRRCYWYAAARSLQCRERTDARSIFFSDVFHRRACPKAGDRLVLYTDGVTEAADGKDEEFGQQRLCVLLQQATHLSSHQTADLVISKVQSWSKSQNDDLTVVICDYGSQAA